MYISIEIEIFVSLVPSPNFHVTNPESGSAIIAIFWVLLSQHVLKTLHQSNHWFTPSHDIVQGVAMVSEVVATRSRGCVKTVNSVGRGKLNSSLSRQRKISITSQPADFNRTQNYVIIGQTHFSRSDGWSLKTKLYSTWAPCTVRNRCTCLFYPDNT